MNLNNDVVRILCFGDSNTWGTQPGTSQRFPVQVRWTGALQKLLGDHYEIIEEGLSARTTNIDDAEHAGEFRNGFKYLVPCLNSQIPLDYVVLFLGTNDLKSRYRREPEQIAEGIEQLIEAILHMEYMHETVPAKVILVVPPVMDDNEEGIRGKFTGGGVKSKKLGPLYKSLADKYTLRLVDLSQVFPPIGHLGADEHRKLAEMLAEQITSV